MLSTSHKFCHSAIQLLGYQMVLALWRFETLGNLVSAHHWHVRTTDLWCITGAWCVSGATIATESTHRAPVILRQMGGVRVTASQVTPLTHSPFVSNIHAYVRINTMIIYWIDRQEIRPIMHYIWLLKDISSDFRFIQTGYGLRTS